MLHALGTNEVAFRSPRSAMWLPSQYLFQDLVRGKAGHQNQRTERDLLQDEGHALVLAVPRHLFGLGTEDMKEVCGRRRHVVRASFLLERNFLSGFESLFLPDEVANFLVESLGINPGS
jgi:hypothetical protein